MVCIAQSSPRYSPTLILAPKEAFMGRSPFLEIHCTLCNSSVDLRVDLCADENGKAVHEECYVKKVTSSQASGFEDRKAWNVRW